MADRARQVEIERMHYEQKKLEKEVQEIESGRHFVADTENDETGISDIGKIMKGPKMPCFEETKDNMNALLHRFEINAETQGWKNGSMGSLFISSLERSCIRSVF